MIFRGLRSGILGKHQGTTRSTSHRFDQWLACGEVLLLLPCNGECQVTPPLHPGRLTWFTGEHTLFEKENHLNLTIIFRFYVNLSGCMHARMIGWRFNHFSSHKIIKIPSVALKKVFWMHDLGKKYQDFSMWVKIGRKNQDAIFDLSDL